VNFDDVAIFDPTAIDKETVGCDWSQRQFRHLIDPLSGEQRF
jgi:hypothetical protein